MAGKCKAKSLLSKMWHLVRDAKDASARNNSSLSIAGPHFGIHKFLGIACLNFLPQINLIISYYHINL